MNYWILQDRQENQTLAGQLANVSNYYWNITSSFRQIRSNDLVLLWQPHINETVRGVHAWGRVVGQPWPKPNAKREWRVDITDVHVLSVPLSSKEIEASRISQLLDVSIMKKGIQRSRRVHSITHSDWTAFQRIRPELP